MSEYDELVKRLKRLPYKYERCKEICEDAANAIQALQARVKELEADAEKYRTALLSCARQAEALKLPCSSDPESPQALRNGRYQSISATAHIALGTIMGPAAESQP